MKIKKGLRITLQIIFILAIFYFMFMHLYRNWNSLKEYEWGFNYLYLILSFVILMIYSVLVIYGWQTILKKIFVKVSFLKLMKVKAIAELGRYIPGMVWHVAGRIYYGKKAGIPYVKTGLSFALEMGINTISGLFIFIFSIPFFLKTDIFVKLLPLFVFIPIGLILMHPKIVNKALNFGLRILKKPKVKIKMRYVDLLKLVLLYSLFWLIMGLGFYLLINSVYPLAFSKILVVAGIYSVAWVAGFLFIIAPSGIGVREGIIAGLLSIFMPLPIAIIISIIARIWTTVGEALLALVVLKIRD